MGRLAVGGAAQKLTEDPPKNVRLLEATLDEPGGVEAEPGSEIHYRGERYAVVEATPPVVKPPSKWRRPAKPVTPKWRLLVQKLDKS